MQKSKLTLAVIGALFAMSAEAGSYVLQANKWGAAQEAAVAAAGGRVVYASAGAGIAVVDSDNPGFAVAMSASRSVATVLEDAVLTFDVPTPAIEFEAAAVDLTNETFYNAQWSLKALQAEQAWAHATGAGVRVAIIDGGVHGAHNDLTNKLDKARSRNFTSPANTCSSLPTAWNCDTGTFWHGTHVAGIVGAQGNNTGTVGVAPDATLISLKALHGGTGSFGWIIAAMLYAADEGGPEGVGPADIINMSLGAETPRRQNAGLVAVLNRAVNYATARGALVVVAAGNSGLNMDKVEVDPANGLDRSTIVVPAESGNAIAVSATSPTGFALGGTDYARPASYSNYGSFIWVSGPGGDDPLPGTANCTIPARPAGSIGAPCWVFDLVLGPSRGTGASTGSYSFAAGTSMAAPAVAGVAALIKQRFPNATPAQLKTKLAQSATDEGKRGQDNFHGHGFVNALRAVTQ